ncbi:MAG: hypothetical protein LC778_08250 [Acidobacteria bacterium]|nr:hypothetical protein [Acidobacteriota bacterium]
MDITKLTAIVSILITLSIASERLVEIIKNLMPSINQENPDAKKEGWRRAFIQILAVLSGIFTAWLASNIPDSGIQGTFTIAAFGLLASGGSAFWNSILEYLLKVKDIKEVEAETKKELKNVEIEKAVELKTIEVEEAKALADIAVNKETLSLHKPPVSA